MRKLFEFVALFITAVSMLLVVSGFHRQVASFSDYDVHHYDLHVTFDPINKVFHGSVGVSVEFLKPSNSIRLNAYYKTLTIDSVVISSAKVSFEQDSDDVYIGLPHSFAPRDSLTIGIYYRGRSDFQGQYDDGGVYFSSENHFATSSEPSFAHRWWPCKDIPSNKATASISITVPEGLTAVSNGTLKSVERHSGFATYSWETKYPIATYLVSVAAAPYKEFSDTYIALDGRRMPVQIYSYPDDQAKARTDFSRTDSILSFFARTFCEYPFLDEKFGFAEVDGDLTMENQTICSIQGNMICGDRRFELTFAHETAHHWFGDLITPADWHHTWLNEGFATYCEALYIEHRDGREAYARHIGNIMSLPPGTFAGSVIGKSDTAFWDSFGTRVYYKGALVLHMLRAMLGDSLFFTVLRNYVNDPHLRYGNARTEDFIRKCEDGYGQGLSWFFNQWLYASADSIDRPELQYSWENRGSKPPYTTVLTIDQLNAPQLLYRLPLDIRIMGADSVAHTAKIIDSLRTQTFEINVAERPNGIIIDPENKVFKTLRHKEGM